MVKKQVFSAWGLDCTRVGFTVLSVSRGCARAARDYFVQQPDSSLQDGFFFTRHESVSPLTPVQLYVDLVATHRLFAVSVRDEAVVCKVPRPQDTHCVRMDGSAGSYTA
jgi:hypothetical protein